MKTIYNYPHKGVGSNWRTSGFFSFLALLVCFTFSSHAQTTYTGDNLGAAVGPGAGTITESVATSTLTGTIGTDYVISNVTMDITHTWVSDLDIFLEAPDGTRLELTSGNGGLGDDYTNTQFEDDGPDGPITSGSPPFTGVFVPEGGAFADTFDGIDLNGSWTLEVTDNFNGDGGTLINFEITFRPPPTCEKPDNLTASNETTTGVELSWDDEPTAILGYEWVVMPTGVPPAVDGSQAATGTTLSGDLMDTVSGLSAGTFYDAYVRSICSISDTSDWSNVDSFTTTPGCGGSFFDNGGPTGDYALDSNDTTTISPDSPGDVVYVEFLSFDVEETWDGLLIYDGPDATAPLIDSGGGEDYNLAPDGSWSGTGSDEFSAEGLTFISTHPTGSLTFVFVSDGFINTSGWEASVTCGPPPTCDTPVNLEISNLTTTGADLSWDDVPTATLGYEWVVMPSGIEPAVDGSEVATGTTLSGDLMASISGLSAGTFYDAYVRSVCSISDSSNWSASESFITLPGNDNFVDAIAVSCDGNYIGSTAGATADVAPSPNVWYSYTGSGTEEVVTLDLCDSDYDTRLRVYTGTEGDLTQIGVNDDSCGLQSQLSFTSDGTTTYFISVGGFGTSAGNYDLNVSCVTPIANDNFVDAIAVECDGNYTGSTLGATPDVAPSSNVWYSFTGSGAAEVVTLDLCDSDYDTRIRVYTGTEGDLTQIAVNDDSCGLQSQLGFSSDGTTTYYISVGGFGSNTGNYDLDVTCITPIVNDNFADAIAAECDGNYTGTTDGATADVAPSANVWYSFTGNGTGELVTLDLCDSDYDTRIRVYTGTEGDLTQVAFNDDSCDLQSQLEFISNGSTTYYISVGGFGSSTGNYDLDVTCAPAILIENDNFDDAIPVACGGNYTGTTDGATFDEGSSAPNVWYSYTGTGIPELVNLDLCDSDYDTRLRVYTGTAGDLTQIATNDDSCGLQSQLNFDSDGVTTYYISVEGFTGTSIGDYDLDVSCAATLVFQDIFTGRGVVSGAVAFNDVDLDGDQDVFVSGALNVSSTGIAGPGASRMYLNDGAGSFTHDVGNSFSALAYSSVSFYDINDDNVMDILLSGELIQFGNNVNKFYTNDGLGDFTITTNFALPLIDRKDFKFADLNGDSNDDLLIIGEDRFNGQPITKIFTSQNNTVNPNLPKVLKGSIDVADIDGDSDLDIFISGDLNGTKISRLYKNEGNYQFSLVAGTSFDGVDDGDSGFADVDDDGDQDLLISGLDSSMNNVLKLYLNDGTGSFNEAAGIFSLSPNILIDAFDIADIDGDNDLDIFMTGYNTTNFRTVTKIWENLLYANRAPENTSVFDFGDDNDFGIGFKLFPNPTDRGYFNIYAPNVEGEVMINITDISGRNVMSQNLTISNNSLTINSENLSTGIYIVRLSAGEQSFTSKLIVK